tara:strand:+ start:9494 stop:10909 length:1416 start_codon:yes stop_codon:yes gene_type:complete
MNDTQTLSDILNKLKTRYENNPPLINFFVELGMNKENNISCVAFYKRFILENSDGTFDVNDIDKIEDLYIKAKGYLNSLNRLIYKYKLKKAIKYNDEDLFFNKISDYKSNQVINIYSNKTLYAFRISDLINLWNDCLIKSENLFCKASELKNPYTNIEFSKHNLYNIFFAIKDSDYIMPSWILLFFYEDFDIKNFTYKYYSSLKDIAIISFMKEGTLYEKIENIDNMLHQYGKEVNYHTLKETLSLCDKLIICNILSNPLQKYLLSTLSCNPLVRQTNKSSLSRWLKNYFENKDNKDLKLYFKTYVRSHRTPITLNPLTRRILRRVIDASEISGNENVILSTSNLINDISYVNPFVPSNTIPRSPTRESVIRNITRNHPPGLLPPPPPPSYIRTVRSSPNPPPPPPVNEENRSVSSYAQIPLPNISSQEITLDSDDDVDMENVENDIESESETVQNRQQSIRRNFRFFPRN